MHDQRDVEEQVAGLAQVALLGGDGVACRRGRGSGACCSSARAASRTCSGSASVRQVRVRGQPGQAARGARRAAAQLADELPGARDDAADERDEQQDVDRGEPHRAVDVEQAELVVERRRAWCARSLKSATFSVVDAGLRDQRAGDRAERQQEQQDQRDPHRGELPPEPAGPADRRRGAGRAAAASSRGRGGQLGAGGAEFAGRPRAGRRGAVGRRRAGRVGRCSWIRSPP